MEQLAGKLKTHWASSPMTTSRWPRAATNTWLASCRSATALRRMRRSGRSRSSTARCASDRTPERGPYRAAPFPNRGVDHGKILYRAGRWVFRRTAYFIYTSSSTCEGGATIAMKWPHSSHANEAMQARLADASDALAATLRSANEALAQSRAAWRRRSPRARRRHDRWRAPGRALHAGSDGGASGRGPAGHGRARVRPRLDRATRARTAHTGRCAAGGRDRRARPRKRTRAG